MRKVLVLVEGQTEEELVKNVLAPAALSRDVHLVPSVVITSASSAATHRGGGSWSHYEKRLRQFLATSYLSKVGLLLDYYAYPKDAPGQARCWWLRPACRRCWSAAPRSAPGGRTCWAEGQTYGRSAVLMYGKPPYNLCPLTPRHRALRRAPPGRPGV